MGEYSLFWKLLLLAQGLSKKKWPCLFTQKVPQRALIIKTKHFRLWLVATTQDTVLVAVLETLPTINWLPVIEDLIMCIFWLQFRELLYDGNTLDAGEEALWWKKRVRDKTNI